MSIVSDRDPRFNSRFWRKVSGVFRYQTQYEYCVSSINMDGQSERTIQTIEDILRVCAVWILKAVEMTIYH